MADHQANSAADVTPQGPDLAGETRSEQPTGPGPEQRIRARAVDLVDVLVYLVILGLSVQFFPKIISESFVLTLLTAVLMKLALEVVMAVKKRTLKALKGANSFPGRLVSVVTLGLLLPGSKLVILWLTELAFGGAVKLGGFFAVTGVIIVMMLARGLVRRLLVIEAHPATSSAD